MRARYDVGAFPTFNFYEWLIQVRGQGFKTVSFDLTGVEDSAYPVEHVLERFYSICLPGPALAGMTVGFGYGRQVARPGNENLIRYFRSGKPFVRFETIKPPGTEKYTVTLRKTVNGKKSIAYRDSDEAVWRDFAREIGALVIQDYEVEKIHLHDRIALYAGARMNFFVSNGPGVFCSLTPYPCMLFNTGDARKALVQEGMKEGEKYPWMLPDQMAIWEKATPESLRRHFYSWEAGEIAQDMYAA